MSISDDSFREDFKPLHIPAHYKDATTDQDKVIFALSQLGQGTLTAVVEKLISMDPSVDQERYQMIAKTTLQGLFDKGLIRGKEQNGEMHYDLGKITEANKGKVDADLLAPGLD